MPGHGIPSCTVAPFCTGGGAYGSAATDGVIAANVSKANAATPDTVFVMTLYPLALCRQYGVRDGDAVPAALVNFGHGFCIPAIKESLTRRSSLPRQDWWRRP